MWNTTFTEVARLAQIVMGWYGFVYATEYTLLPTATTVAVEMVRAGGVVSRERIEAADRLTGGAMQSLKDNRNPDTGPAKQLIKAGMVSPE